VSTAPLADVKIVDLMWALAGPTATRTLADYGATVVRVESTVSIDVARTLAPFHNGEPGPENSGLYGNYNAGKLGLTLDLSKQEGRDVVRDLVRWADVLTEAFSPGVLAKWGLDYNSLREVRPDLIMLSTSLFGQTGPLAELDGFGTMGAALAGFTGLAGWPDRSPVGPFGAYTDYVAPRFTATAILAAMEYRDATGEGTYIDQSQTESSLHFLSTALLAAQTNQGVSEPTGNRDPQMAPHGVYRVTGDDNWVAIAVRHDEDWARLCDVVGASELTADARFATLSARKANEDELDAIVEAWTSSRSGADVEAALQGAGVPAHIVQGSVGATQDPQLKHRGHFVELPHPLHGRTTIEGTRFRLSRTPAEYTEAAPTFGRDNDYVLSEVLGYEAERISALAASGALG
jgi:crotonobetainyl-CoA:carnitine CoA-transferase CaiB-like acyl-CoA transferase